MQDIMDEIMIDEGKVSIVNSTIRKNISNLRQSEMDIRLLTNKLNVKIKFRSDVEERLRKLCNELDNVQDQLKKIEKFIDRSVDDYFEKEDYLVNKSYKFSDNIFDKYKQMLAFDPHKYIAARDAILDFLSNGLDPSTLLLLGKNIRFSVDKRDGKVFIKLITNGYTDRNYVRYRNFLVHNLLDRSDHGNSGLFNKRYMNRLINGGGIPLYVDGRGVIADNMYRFKGMESVAEYIQSKHNPILGMKSTFKSTFVQDMKFWDDFNWKNTSGLGKAGKAFGAAGTIFTLGDNFHETFYESGKFKFSPGKGVDFGVNVGVDLAMGAGGMAAGAAVGSLIAPPLGTVVGAGVGAGVNFVINTKWGEPPKSVVDHTKDIANDVVDAAWEGVKDVAGAAADITKGIGKHLGRIFW